MAYYSCGWRFGAQYIIAPEKGVGSFVFSDAFLTVRTTLQKFSTTRTKSAINFSGLQF